jgi:murein DD-endopeptidase MepM/ murein hydrolase activator NlpD
MQEPPLHPFDDTSPTLTVNPHEEEAERRSVWGFLSLVGAGIFTLAAVIVFLLPAPAPAPLPPQTVVANAPTDAPTHTNTPELPRVTDTVPQVLGAPASIPTLDRARLEAFLQTPIAPLVQDSRSWQYNPFTFIPERPRSEFVEYTVVAGDTIDQIAIQYGLKPESIAWCNDRRIVFAIRPGDVLRIPPVDGACHLVLGTRQESIEKIAAQYKVTAQDLINSPYAPLFDRSPSDILPGGTNLFVQGGQGELINWNPGSDVEKDENGVVRSISFAPGQAGSCGAVPPGGGAAWGNPLPNGTWVRGFSVGHTGIDLSAPVGTPIYAANSGPVLFSGFSSWGYGEAVVLAHGAFSTLYGHMTVRNVACGQFVNVGQVVGTVGSTGNSTGPHLHFEIRFDNEPLNPSGMPGIGW